MDGQSGYSVLLRRDKVWPETSCPNQQGSVYAGPTVSSVSDVVLDIG